MRLFSRGTLILLALITISGMLLAQDDTITVVGSGIAQPVFQALAEASGTDANLSLNVTGTTTGFTEFCAGQADITTASRAISAEEAANCNANNVTYFEILLGQEIAVLVANPALDFAQCLTGAQVDQIFAPSAQGTTTNWSQVIEGAADTPLAVFAPTDDTSTYAILDRLVEGDGLRTDATLLGSGSDIVQAVSETSGAVGVVSQSDALAAGESVKILDLDAAEITGCRTANADNVENNLYPLADRLYAYVNLASLDKPGLTELLEYVTSDAAVSVVEEQGFAAPTANTLEKNRDVLQAAVSGEPITTTSADFAVPTGIAGTVNIGGAAIGYEFLQSSTTAFNDINPDITINTNIDGEPAGFRRLCNGELDMMIAYRDLSDEERSNCEANNISTLSIDLGRQAVVLLANAQNEQLACLTTDQIVTAWRADSAESVTQWNHVSESFPEIPLTLFAPDKGSGDNDLLLNIAAGSGNLIVREDAHFEADPLYRAAATANVEGGLTLMNWSDYQQVLDNNQANVQVVGVDSSSGCVTPSIDTIAEGSYPISRRAQLVINQDSLAKPEVQAFVWFLMSNENYTTLESSGFVGVRFGDLAAVRSTLQQAFREAEIRALEAAAEATPEATAEATEAATAEPTAETAP